LIVAQQNISKLRNQYVDQAAETKQKMAPSFTISPRRARAYENEPARFECAVAGNPKPKISWYVNERLAVNVSSQLLNISLKFYDQSFPTKICF